MKLKTTFLFLLMVCLLAFAFPGAAAAQTLPAPQPQTISGDQLVVGDNYVLKTGQTLNGSLVVLGGNAVVESGAVVNGDVALMGGNLDLTGTINGNISFVGANVSLRSDAVVRGDINSLGGNLEGEEQATVQGEIRHLTPRALMFNLDNPDVSSIPKRGLLNSLSDFFGSIFSKLLQTFGLAVLALLLGLIIAKPLGRVSNSFSAQPWLSGGVGLLTLVLAPFILVLLSITIILIPVTLVAAFALGIAVVFGWIAVGYEVGKRMASLFKTEWADAVSAGLGTLVLGLAVWLVSYVPCIGWMSGLIVSSLGLGGVILSRFGTQEYAERYPANRTVVQSVPPTASVEQKPQVEPESPADQPAKNPDEPSI